MTAETTESISQSACFYNAEYHKQGQRCRRLVAAHNHIELLIHDPQLAMAAATMHHQHNCTFQLIECITIEIWSYNCKGLEVWKA